MRTAVVPLGVWDMGSGHLVTPALSVVLVPRASRNPGGVTVDTLVWLTVGTSFPWQAQSKAYRRPTDPVVLGTHQRDLAALTEGDSPTQ